MRSKPYRMGHPKRHDDMRLVAECVAFLLVILLIVVVGSLA